jgi:hypothetical protein
MTRDAVRAALTDRAALTATLYGEARGEPLMGQIAVACTIRNRVMADLGHDGRPDWWGEGYRGVCLAPAQYSCWWGEDTNADVVYAAAEVIIAGRPIPAPMRRVTWVADGVLSEAVEDITKGATHYCTRRLFDAHPPAWARGLAPVAEWGRHVFFAHVP